MIYYITKNQPLIKWESVEYCNMQYMFEYFKDKSIVQVDTETQGFFDFSNRVLLFQLGCYEDQFVIDFQSLTKTDKQNLTTYILANPSIKKLLQNAKFDIKFIWLEGMDICNIYDTMLAEQILTAGKDLMDGYHSLYSIVKRYCNIELDKTLEHGKISERYVKYAADDVKYLEFVRDKQIEQLQALNLCYTTVSGNVDDQNELSVLGLENKVCIVFASMEYNGILFDSIKWKEVENTLKSQIADINEELVEIVWSNPLLSKYQLNYQDLFTSCKPTVNINWESPLQKLKLLQLIDSKITDTSERVLSKFKAKHLIVSKLIELSKVNKLYKAFALKMYSHINKVTYRIHTDFFQILTTGRVSCSNPNMQQIPSRSKIGSIMRSCFIAPKGYKIVGGDFSGCELRIIAEFSKDPIWLDAFLEGKDLHSVLCAATFNIDIKDVKLPTPFKPDIKYRDVQKTINFGLAYGMSEFKLADTIEIPVKQAKSIIDKFFLIVPYVKKFLTVLGERGKKYGRSRTPNPYGRIRWYDGYENKEDLKRQGEIERAAKNAPIQGANADITKLALVRIYECIKANNYDVKMLLQVHDEIQTEVNEEFAEEWSKIMATIMENSGKEIIQSIPMPVDCSINDYWSK